MNVLVTAGPTRQYIDTVRFITNASSGRMGCAAAEAAAHAGHDVTLLLGPTPHAAPGGCRTVPFTTIEELKDALDRRFDACDALIMAAAVGDFRPETVSPDKLPRAGGPVTLTLVPTEDLLAGLGRRKRAGQIIVAFAVEDAGAGPTAPGQPDAPDRIEAKARREMIAKNADFVVVNTPEAMAAEESRACILSREGVVLPWALRPKVDLAERVIRLLGG